MCLNLSHSRLNRYRYVPRISSRSGAFNASVRTPVPEGSSGHDAGNSGNRKSNEELPWQTKGKRANDKSNWKPHDFSVLGDSRPKVSGVIPDSDSTTTTGPIHRRRSARLRPQPPGLSSTAIWLSICPVRLSGSDETTWNGRDEMSLRQEVDDVDAGDQLLGLGHATRGGITPIPGPQQLILTILRQLADGAEHASVEIRDNLAARFEITAEELARKQGGVSGRFVNHVAWPLAWLNRAKAIVRVRTGTYRITVYGIAILEECKHSHQITLKELRAFLREQPAAAFHGEADCTTSSLSDAV